MQKMNLRGTMVERDAAAADCGNIVHHVYKIVAAAKRKSFAEGVVNPRHCVRGQADRAAPESQDDVATRPRVHQPLQPSSPNSRAKIRRESRSAALAGTQSLRCRATCAYPR